MDEMFCTWMATTYRAMSSNNRLKQCMHMKMCVMSNRNLYRTNQDEQTNSLLSAELSTQHVLELSVHLSCCMQSDASMQSCFLSSQTTINLICCSLL